MTKLITLFIGCSLAFAASVQAEQQDNKKKKPAQKQQAVAPKQNMAPKVRTAPQQHPMANPRVQGVHPQHVPNPNTTKIQTQKVHQTPGFQTNKLPPVHTNRVPAVQTNKMPPVHTNRVPAVQTNKMPPVHTNKLPAVQTNKLPQVHTNRLPNVQTNNLHTNPNTVRNFPRHTDFHARPNTTVASATFNRNYRINGAQNWRGNHYEVFRSYRPQWHDRSYWHSHHNHITLIGGGWYFWNAGYWFPAWGYDSSASYYPYDGPIYVGSSPRPFDQIVADVQSSLQEQGYYHGEVDGLVGPLTREALTEYQGAQGLEPTAAVDEPTLNALGLS